MKHGVQKPSRIKDRRKYSFHRTFGGVTPNLFPLEFSVDNGFPMKDQNLEGLPYGCTGFAQADLCESQDLIPYNERFVYEKTLEMEGKSGDEGCLIEDSLKVICSLGIERTDKSNKPEDNKRGAYYAVEKSKFDWMDSIRSVMLTNYQVNKVRTAVTIGIPWFPIFESIGSDGMITDAGWGDLNTASWHNPTVSKWVQRNGQPYLAVKSWQGESYGDHGWIYFSRFLINKLLDVPQTEALTVAPKGSVSINTIKVNLLMAMVSFLKTLVSKLLLQKKSL